MTDDTTFWLLMAGLPALLALEIYLLVRRGQGVSIATISMVLRDRATHISSVVFFAGGMCSHWWWPGDVQATRWGSVAFWVLIVALLMEDAYLWHVAPNWWPKWLQWQRKPILVLAAGFIAGKLLFPQVG